MERATTRAPWLSRPWTAWSARTHSLSTATPSRSFPCASLCWPLASSVGQTARHDSHTSPTHSTTMILSNNKEANDMRSSRTRPITMRFSQRACPEEQGQVHVYSWWCMIIRGRASLHLSVFGVPGSRESITAPRPPQNRAGTSRCTRLKQATAATNVVSAHERWAERSPFHRCGSAGDNTGASVQGSCSCPTLPEHAAGYGVCGVLPH